MFLVWICLATKVFRMTNVHFWLIRALLHLKRHEETFRCLITRSKTLISCLQYVSKVSNLCGEIWINHFFKIIHPSCWKSDVCSLFFYCKKKAWIFWFVESSNEYFRPQDRVENLFWLSCETAGQPLWFQLTNLSRLSMSKYHFGSFSWQKLQAQFKETLLYVCMYNCTLYKFNLSEWVNKLRVHALQGWYTVHTRVNITRGITSGTNINTIHPSSNCNEWKSFTLTYNLPMFSHGWDDILNQGLFAV